jgi:hypothetical protein
MATEQELLARISQQLDALLVLEVIRIGKETGLGDDGAAVKARQLAPQILQELRRIR